MSFLFLRRRAQTDDLDRARPKRTTANASSERQNLRRGTVFTGSPRTSLTPRPPQWKKAALNLDNHLRLSDWKRSAPNAYYDSALIRRVLRSLRELRERDDVEGVRAVLEVALRSNFAGVESFHLYSETFYGTKDLIEEYVDEGESSCAVDWRELIRGAQWRDRWRS